MVSGRHRIDGMIGVDAGYSLLEAGLSGRRGCLSVRLLEGVGFILGAFIATAPIVSM
jgi:hypothetical protein